MFKLRELPFDAAHNAVVSKQTCDYHHGKHHATYVVNLNKLTESGEFAGKGLYEIVTAASGGLFNNAAQVYNHDFYWDCIAKPSEPSAELKSALAENFADFKSEFLAAATAHFGSGWVWARLRSEIRQALHQSDTKRRHAGNRRARAASSRGRLGARVLHR